MPSCRIDAPALKSIVLAVAYPDTYVPSFPDTKQLEDQ